MIKKESLHIGSGIAFRKAGRSNVFLGEFHFADRRGEKKFINAFSKEPKSRTVNALVHLIWRLNEPVDTLMQGVPRVAGELPVQ